MSSFLFDNKHLDAIIIQNPSNLFYFTKYQNEDAIIVLTPSESFYISDGRVKEEFNSLLTSFQFIQIEIGERYIDRAIDLLLEKKVKYLGYEDATILHKTYYSLKKFKLLPISEKINFLRSIKRKDEIDLIEKAQNITDLVFENLLGYIKIGMTESEISSYINSEIYRNNCSLAFDTIVAFGNNTSKPHAHPGNKVLEYGDPITVDYGAKYNGYCSDMTRSFSVGKPEDEYIKIYNVVLDAQNKTIDSIHAGMTGKECDFIARDHFNKYNYEDYFTHSLGHSLGIDIHEYPNLSRFNEKSINEGVVTSVEPGLYFPTRFGVRIEDIVLFKDTFVQNLTKSKKELIIL